MKRLYSIIVSAVATLLVALPLMAQVPTLPADATEQSLAGQPYQIIVQPGGIVNLGGQETLGGGTNFDYVDTTDGYYVDGTAIIDGSGVVLTSGGGGLRVSSGNIQFKNSGGGWTTITGGAASDVLTSDGANLGMYPINNAGGSPYVLILGGSATSTPADGSTQFYVSGASNNSVFAGKVTIGASGTGADLLLYSDTTGQAVTWDASANAMDWGGMATTTSDTGAISLQGALKASSTVESTGAARLYSTLIVDGAVTLSSTVGITGLTTMVNASSTLDSVATTLYVGGTNGLVLSDGSILDSSGAISTGDENLSGTGNLSYANITGSGDLTIGTTDLFVDVSEDKVGVGTTTPYATLSIDTNTGVDAFVIGSSTATYLKVNVNGVLLGNESLGGSADLRWDGTTNTNFVLADVSAERFGIGTSTPFATLSINTGAGENAFTIGSSTATYLRVNTLGVLIGNETLGDSADLRWDGTTNTHLLFADVSTERIGIGSSTPFAQLAINANAGENSFVIGSSTETYLQVTSNGVLRGNVSAGDIADFRWDGTTNTHLLFADVSTEKVGIGSSTPFAQLTVGAGLAGTGAATSTISTGRFCMYAGQENGENIFVYLSDSAPNRQPFATSTTSCF